MIYDTQCQQDLSRWLLCMTTDRFRLVVGHVQVDGRIWPPDSLLSTDLKTEFCSIFRLNSGIFWSFDLKKWKSNLTSSDCRASKIIWNDTKPEPISWELNIENPIFNFCLGVWVGGHDATNFSHISNLWDFCMHNHDSCNSTQQLISNI